MKRALLLFCLFGLSIEAQDGGGALTLSSSDIQALQVARNLVRDDERQIDELEERKRQDEAAETELAASIAERIQHDHKLPACEDPDHPKTAWVVSVSSEQTVSAFTVTCPDEDIE